MLCSGETNAVAEHQSRMMSVFILHVHVTDPHICKNMCSHAAANPPACVLFVISPDFSLPLYIYNLNMKEF